MRDAKKTPKMITLKNDRLSYGIVSIGMKLFFQPIVPKAGAWLYCTLARERKRKF